MCLAGFVPANESTRLTESMVPVRMEFVRLQIFSKWLLLFFLFLKPLSAALGASSMYKFL